jgi:hypothetical protein
MSSKLSLSPYLTLAEAVTRLGEDGESELVDAHVKGRLMLIGRRRVGMKVETVPARIPPDALAEWKPDGAGAVRFNLDANTLEANAGTAEGAPDFPDAIVDSARLAEHFAAFERNAQHGYVDVRVATHEIAELKKSVAGDKHASARAEAHCRAWLAERMKVSPCHPTPKRKCLEEAKRNFPGLSDRGFVRAWDEAIQTTGAVAWSKAGRRSAPPQSVASRTNSLR